jgi:hypothetical protein
MTHVLGTLTDFDNGHQGRPAPGTVAGRLVPTDRVFVRLTYAFVPWVGSIYVSAFETTSRCLGGRLKFQLHGDEHPGEAVSGSVNVTFTADPSGDKVRLQQVQAEDQPEWVVPFARGWLQAAGFAQLLGGAALRQHTIDGEMQVTADRTGAPGTRPRVVTSRWAIRSLGGPPRRLRRPVTATPVPPVVLGASVGSSRRLRPVLGAVS